MSIALTTLANGILVSHLRTSANVRCTTHFGSSCNIVVDAYYTQDTWEQLHTVDSIAPLRRLQVPPGLYVCARSSSARKSSRAAANRRGGSADRYSPLQSSASTNGSPLVPSSNIYSKSSASSASSQLIAAYNSSFTPLSASSPSTPPGVHSSPDRMLAPLSYLTSIPPRPRNAIDDEALRSFRSS